MSDLLRGYSQKKKSERGRMGKRLSREVLKSSRGLIGANYTSRVVPLGQGGLSASQGPQSRAVLENVLGVS